MREPRRERQREREKSRQGEGDLKNMFTSCGSAAKASLLERFPKWRYAARDSAGKRERGEIKKRQTGRLKFLVKQKQTELLSWRKKSCHWLS